MRNTEESLGFALLERQGAHGSVLTSEAKTLLRALQQTEEQLLKKQGKSEPDSALASFVKVVSFTKDNLAHGKGGVAPYPALEAYLYWVKLPPKRAHFIVLVQSM